MAPWVDRDGGRKHVVACVVLVALAAAFIAPVIQHGWVPFDEGTLGQSAHRILLGELPHRDFDDVYTGGLSFAHALAFRTFGENLVSLRLVLFVAILCVMPACYYIASRFVSPIIAAAVSLAALLSSFPSYPAAMPSWYNLIFALFGCGALLRYIETDKRRWVFLAGAFGGLSVTVKIVGVFFVAAASVFIIFHANAGQKQDNDNRKSSGRWLASLPMLAALALLVAAPFAIMRGRFRFADAISLGLPVTAVCLAVGVEVVRVAKKGQARRALTDAVSTAWPLALGVMIPLACLMIPYVRTDALGDLYRGVIVLPQKRLLWAAEDGPPLVGVLLGIVPVWLAMSGRFSDRAISRLDMGVIVAVQSALLVTAAFSLNVTAALWSVVRSAAPVMVVVGSVLIISSRASERSNQSRREMLLVLLSIAAWCALIQFPMETYQYFLYTLPLFVFVMCATTAFRGRLARRVGLSTLGAFIGLALMLRSGFVGRSGGSRVVVPRSGGANLDLPRGGLVIPRQERDQYVQLAAAIREHSRSRFIYAAPDAPEVYFLSERENATRTLFDFFDDSVHQTDRVLAAIRNSGADVVVINTSPRFSEPLPTALRDSLLGRFPETTRIGHFEVHWRR